MKKTILLSCILLLSGCVATNKLYEGPEKPKTDLSIVNQLYIQSTSNSNLHYHFLLKKVDGNSLPDSFSIAGVELIPGEHTFTYEILKVISLPSSIYVNIKTYDLKVNTEKGKKGFVVFKSPDGGKELCMMFSDINQPYPSIRPKEFPPSDNYKHKCVNAGVDVSDKAWIRK